MSCRMVTLEASSAESEAVAAEKSSVTNKNFMMRMGKYIIGAAKKVREKLAEFQESTG